jgi:hypothetical protein
LARRLFIILPLIIFCLTVQDTVCWAVDEACAKSTHLFNITRNKNRNIVYYDVCLQKNNDLSDSNPVTAYWVLENGKKEKLGVIDKQYAYGISAQERLTKNRLTFATAALKDLKITVENINKKYRAVTTIKNRDIIIEKVFIDAEESTIGLPKVLYADIYGWTRKGNVRVRERIVPH